MGSAVMNKNGGARSRPVPHRNLRTQTARPVYGVRCANRKSAGRTGTCGEIRTGLLKRILFTGAGYPQVPELRVPARTRRGHAEHMSRHDTADHTSASPAGLPPAPRSWPYIALRDQPISARGTHSGEPLSPWPRRSQEPPAASTRRRGELRRRTGVPGHTARTRHGRGPRCARHLWCAENHRTADADRLVVAPTLSGTGMNGSGSERPIYEAEPCTTAHSAPPFVPVRVRAGHRGIPAIRAVRAGQSDDRGGSETTVSGRNRPVRGVVPAASATGRGAATQMIGAGNSAATTGPGDIERRARRYERRMAHCAGPTDHDRVPVLLDTAGSQRADPGRRSPAVPPDGSPLPSGTPLRSTPGRRYRRAPVRNPIRRAAPEDHTGIRSRSFRYRSPGGVGITARPPQPPSTGRAPAICGGAQFHAWRKAGYARFHSAIPQASQRRVPVADFPAPGARSGGGGRRPVIRFVPVGDKQLVTRSVSVRARHRRSVVGRRRWDVLLGAAFTTVLVAFPLGPGATAAAYSGGPMVLAQSYTGDTADGRGSTGAPGANSVPPGSSADGGPARTAPITESADEDGPDVVVDVVARDLSVSHEAAAPRRPTVSATHPPLDRTGQRPKPPAFSGDSTAIPAAVAACAASGSASGSMPWSGSADSAAGSASGSACTVVPALGELVRTLIRLAPKIAPPCPCPNGRK